MTNVDKNVEINLPLENLIDTLCKLPPDTLREVKQRIERQLQDPDRSQEQLDDLHEDDLWGLEGNRESDDDERPQPRWRKCSESHLNSKGPWQRSCVKNA